MSSLIYDSCIYGIFRSMIHFDTDSFRMILVTGDYIPDKSLDTSLYDVNGYETDGNGYKEGGISVDVSVRKNGSGIDISLSGGLWENATLTAAGAVYYKSNSESKDLICFVQFPRIASSTNGKFTVTESIIRLEN